MTAPLVVPWGTVNIGRGVPLVVAKQNVVKIRRAFHFLPVVGWQEIDEDDRPDEHDLLNTVFPDKLFFRAGFAGKEPITMPRAMFTPGKVQRIKIMDGVARSEPGKASPTRFVVVQRATPKGCKNEIAAVNTHFPNFEPSDPRWQKCAHALQEVMGELHEEGVTAVWTGDTNANRPQNMPKVHPLEKRIVAAGNDFIGIVPGKVKVDVRGTSRVNLTIDGHDGHFANLSFQDRRAA